jgi:hypothetical protein
VAQDDHAVAAVLLLLVGEEPAAGRRHSEDAKHAGAQPGPRDRFGAAGRPPQERLLAVRAEPLERLRVVPRVERQVAQVVAERADGRSVLFGNAHQSFRGGIGERPQEDAVDDRDERGGDAEAEGQGQERRE